MTPGYPGNWWGQGGAGASGHQVKDRIRGGEGCEGAPVVYDSRSRVLATATKRKKTIGEDEGNARTVCCIPVTYYLVRDTRYSLFIKRVGISTNK